MPAFFETVGDRIVMGRPITDADNADAHRVAVINEAFAKKFFPKENPISQAVENTFPLARSSPTRHSS